MKKKELEAEIEELKNDVRKLRKKTFNIGDKTIIPIVTGLYYIKGEPYNDYKYIPINNIVICILKHLNLEIKNIPNDFELQPIDSRE